MNINILRALALTGLMALGTAAHASVLYEFYGEDAGGAGSATMEISIVGNTLTATVNNTSPTTLLSGTGTNTSAITGFGFDLVSPVPTLQSWTLTALAGDKTTVTTIGSNGGTGTWVVDGTIGGLNLDFLACDGSPNCDAIQGALYNPAATTGFGAEPNWFTTAVLTLNFATAPELDAFLGDGTCTGPSPCSPFVRFQNVGLNGDGSLRLPGVSVPEPATLALLGLGLLGLAAIRRRHAM